MTDIPYLIDIIIILASAVIVVPLFQRIKLNPILGYLVAGVIIGPFGVKLIGNTGTVHTLAEFGVVFLLFAIGLEFSIVRLRALWKYIFGLGLLQVLVTGSIIATILYYGFHANPDVAILVGAALALSSTAFCIQILNDRNALSLRYGRFSVAILVLQDLAVVPLLTFVTLLDDPSRSIGTAMLLAMGKAIVALVLIVMVGRLILRPIYKVIASFRHAELFMATTLLVILGTGWLTSLAHLSIALGAFLAGLLLAETEYRHQVEADIKPFKGILLGLFFITIGMGINFHWAIQHIGDIFICLLALLAIKTTVTTLLGRLFSIPWITSARVGMLLSQSGEFAFVLFSVAMGIGVLPKNDGQFLLLLVSFSMATTPLMVFFGDQLEKFWEKRNKNLYSLEDEYAEIHQHVIIAGFGRVGQTVAKLLTEYNIPYIALDLDGARVSACRKAGLPVFYGDASALNVHMAAGAKRARSAIITLNQEKAAERAVLTLRRHFPDMKIFARATDARHARRLEKCGATERVLETIEASLQLAAIVLAGNGFPLDDVAKTVETYRENDYERLGELIASEHR